jgi:DNA-binding transcriptional ArsR family regulator
VAYQDALSVLADPTRRTIFERLVDGPCAVSVLASSLPVSRPAVSQHLRVLKDAGLVTDRTEGTRRIYQVDPTGLTELQALVQRFWDRSLVAFKAALEHGEAEDA